MRGAEWLIVAVAGFTFYGVAAWKNTPQVVDKPLTLEWHGTLAEVISVDMPTVNTVPMHLRVLRVRTSTGHVGAAISEDGSVKVGDQVALVVLPTTEPFGGKSQVISFAIHPSRTGQRDGS